MPIPPWLESMKSDVDKFALTVFYDVACMLSLIIFLWRYADPVHPPGNFSISQKLLKNARDSLRAALASPDVPNFPRALYILQFSARHQKLRRRFIAHDEVIADLILALTPIAKSHNKDLYPLVMDSLCSLIDDGTYDQGRIMHVLILYSQSTNQRYQPALR